MLYFLPSLIRKITIYPLGSVIRPLKNRAQHYKTPLMYAYKTEFHAANANVYQYIHFHRRFGFSSRYVVLDL